MSNTKDKLYEYLETSDDAKGRGLRRISRPVFLGAPKGSKESKSRITIYLDADIVEHFKTHAESLRTGYQTLINQALREKIDGTAARESAVDPLERLLSDKEALKRLKAELEAV
jgi:uncharacterized protein (DUF4415 family)